MPFLIWLIVLAVFNSMAVRPTEITDRRMTLTGVSEQFVDATSRPSATRRRRHATPSSSRRPPARDLDDDEEELLPPPRRRSIDDDGYRE